MFHEAVKTNLLHNRDYVVDQTSAAPILPGVAYGGIEATHSNIAKFGSKTAPGYIIVASTIKRYANECCDLIKARWIAERAARKRVQEELAKEALGIYDEPRSVSQASSSAWGQDLRGTNKLAVGSSSQPKANIR